MQQAHEHSTISVDPNIRPALADESGRLKLARLLRYADVIKLSDEDLAWMAPTTTASSAADQWISAGAALVIVTMGSEGAVAYTSTSETYVPAQPTTVVDTVDAGDTLMAAVIDALSRHELAGGENRDKLRDISRKTRHEFSSMLRAAAITVSR